MMGKDPGGIPDQLPNSVKTTVVDTLRSQWPLALLVDVLVPGVISLHRIESRSKEG